MSLNRTAPNFRAALSDCLTYSVETNAISHGANAFQSSGCCLYGVTMHKCSLTMETEIKLSSCVWKVLLQVSILFVQRHVFSPMVFLAFSPTIVESCCNTVRHYSDVIMCTMASQITSVSIVHSTVCPGTDQRKHQRSASLTGEFPAQKASNAENVSIWWRHHGLTQYYIKHCNI